jgi:SPP1 gp7 family putative phage head morphogenesis protein
MSDFIADNQGRRVPFKEYEAKAKEIFNTYNQTWLKTEIFQAENSATMASKWQDIEEDKDVLPMLKYVTVGDERVRQDHRPLDGVTRPVDDPFWDTYYPPNGWRCRCDVNQEDEEATPSDLGAVKLPEVPPSMEINVGKQKVLFGPQHPYFIVEDQFKELKDNNFGLPIPKEAQIVTPAEDVFKELEGWKGKHRYGTLKGKKLKLQKELEAKTKSKIPDSLIENVSENLTVLETSKEGAHYHPFMKTVYFEQDLKHYDKTGTYHRNSLIAHELGHAAHFNTKELLSHAEKSDEFKAFLDVFTNELEEMSKGLDIRGRGKAKTLRYLSEKVEKELNDAFNNVFTAKTQAKKDFFKQLKREASGFSDTIQGYSRGNFGSGHTKAYQKSNGELEIWAHLSENYYVGNSVFQKYLPKTYAAGLDYMENFLKRNGGL